MILSPTMYMKMYAQTNNTSINVTHRKSGHESFPSHPSHDHSYCTPIISFSRDHYKSGGFFLRSRKTEKSKNPDDD